jgi:hypothetical protein
LPGCLLARREAGTWGAGLEAAAITARAWPASSGL